MACGEPSTPLERTERETTQRARAVAAREEEGRRSGTADSRPGGGDVVSPSAGGDRESAGGDDSGNAVPRLFEAVDAMSGSDGWIRDVGPASRGELSEDLGTIRAALETNRDAIARLDEAAASPRCAIAEREIEPGFPAVAHLPETIPLHSLMSLYLVGGKVRASAGSTPSALARFGDVLRIAACVDSGGAGRFVSASPWVLNALGAIRASLRDEPPNAEVCERQRDDLASYAEGHTSAAEALRSEREIVEEIARGIESDLRESSDGAPVAAFRARVRERLEAVFESILAHAAEPSDARWARVEAQLESMRSEPAIEGLSLDRTAGFRVEVQDGASPSADDLRRFADAVVRAGLSSFRLRSTAERGAEIRAELERTRRAVGEACE